MLHDFKLKNLIPAGDILISNSFLPLKLRLCIPSQFNSINRFKIKGIGRKGGLQKSSKMV